MTPPPQKKNTPPPLAHRTRAAAKKQPAKDDDDKDLNALMDRLLKLRGHAPSALLPKSMPNAADKRNSSVTAKLNKLPPAPAHKPSSKMTTSEKKACKKCFADQKRLYRILAALRKQRAAEREFSRATGEVGGGSSSA